MSNGFKALRHESGHSQLSEYDIDPTNTETIWNGDMVILTAGKIVQAATNEAHVGTFVGCMYVAADGSQQFSPYWNGVAGSTDVRGLVSDTSGTSYVVTDSSGTLTVGALCDLVDGGGEVASIGASTMTVGASTNGDFSVKSIVDAAANTVEIVIV